MGEKVEIPVPEGMIPVHNNKATAVLAAPGDLERLRESMAQELVMSTLAGRLAVFRLPGDAVVCPVPLTVRGTQALVSFAPLAFKLFFAARQNAVLRRSPFPSP